MDKEPGTSDDKPKPPPPDLRKAPAPPTPPGPAEPPKSPLQGQAAAPLQIGPPSGGSARHDSDDNDHLPGADASFANRVIAAVIDGVVAVGIILGVTIFLSFVPDFLDFVSRQLRRLMYLAGAGYFLTRDSLPFLGGQSVGKKAMGIRAVTMEGESLSGNWQPGVLRNVALLVPLFALVELFVLISRQEKHPLLRLGDEWAKTKVINAGDEGGQDASDAR